jgi:hypothetical protein
LYVLASSVPSQSLIFLQSWSIGGPLHWILLVSHLPTIRILTANLLMWKKSELFMILNARLYSVFYTLQRILSFASHKSKTWS